EFVPFDEHVAVIYSDLKSRLEKAGCPAPEIDMQIASTAIANNLILVTRNTGDFSNIAEVSSLMLENWFEAE
ncbi:MAG: type II toxin-antitoxin system VapC family toxin, partial [Spirochaetales bacterium]|nr:type II toxin-antitoxin system VapC family toxin [Spirochaetales bacterium]